MADPTAMAQFLANGGQKLPPKPKRETPSPKREPMKRGKGPRKVSIKQQVDEARWAGIREASIYWLNRLDPDGARCFECGRKAQRLDADHVHPRSKGGRSTVSNLALLCRQCHQRKHGEVQWSSVAADKADRP